MLDHPRETVVSESVTHFDQAQGPVPASEIRVFAIVVLYRILPAESASFLTLLQAAGASSSSGVRLHIRVVDNTPGGQDPGPLPPGVEYCASPENPGLSKPYNDAWRAAERGGYRWLLTLDQDTSLPENLLVGFARAVRQYEQVESVAAIVPRILDRGRPISPLRYVGAFLPMVVPAGAGCEVIKHALAVNSAALLRVSALRDIDGYDEAFPLHNSDTGMFLRLDKAGKEVVVANEIVVSHELAIMDREGRMSGDRYRLMLADERAFYDLHMGFLGRMERMLRLMGRLMKDLLQRRSGDFVDITVREIWFRMHTRRRDRVARFALDAHSGKA